MNISTNCPVLRMVTISPHWFSYDMRYLGHPHTHTHANGYYSHAKYWRKRIANKMCLISTVVRVFWTNFEHTTSIEFQKRPYSPGNYSTSHACAHVRNSNAPKATTADLLSIFIHARTHVRFVRSCSFVRTRTATRAQSSSV